MATLGKKKPTKAPGKGSGKDAGKGKLTPVDPGAEKAPVPLSEPGRSPKGVEKAMGSQGFSMVDDIERAVAALDSLAQKTDQMFGDHAGTEIRKYAAQIRTQGMLTLLSASNKQVQQSDNLRMEAYFRLNELLLAELVGLAMVAELAQERSMAEKAEAPELYPIFSFPAPKSFHEHMKWMRSYVRRITGQAPQDFELIVKALKFAIAYPEAFTAMPSTIGRSEAHLNRFLFSAPGTALVPPRLPKDSGGEEG